jgi:hypothetical protein
MVRTFNSISSSFRLFYFIFNLWCHNDPVKPLKSLYASTISKNEKSINDFKISWWVQVYSFCQKFFKFLPMPWQMTQNLISIFCDQNIIFESHSSNVFILLDFLGIEILGIFPF